MDSDPDPDQMQEWKVQMQKWKVHNKDIVAFIKADDIIREMAGKVATWLAIIEPNCEFLPGCTKECDDNKESKIVIQNQKVIDWDGKKESENPVVRLFRLLKDSFITPCTPNKPITKCAFHRLYSMLKKIKSDTQALVDEPDIEQIYNINKFENFNLQQYVEGRLSRLLALFSADYGRISPLFVIAQSAMEDGVANFSGAKDSNQKDMIFRTIQEKRDNQSRAENAAQDRDIAEKKLNVDFDENNNQIPSMTDALILTKSQLPTRLVLLLNELVNRLKKAYGERPAEYLERTKALCSEAKKIAREINDTFPEA